jgi:hypothetical protein
MNKLIELLLRENVYKMDQSTDNVKIAVAFISDILAIFKEKSQKDYEVLKKMTEGIDFTNPMNMVPMEIYNNMCNWIEKQIGQSNTRLVGRQIGRTAFEAMKNFKMVTDDSTPLEVMKALANVASTMIQDPKKRGWEILESGSKFIVMRRTQTFNSTLQFGLLDEIIRKTKVLSPKVDYVKSIAAGDEFDDYKISWL